MRILGVVAVVVLSSCAGAELMKKGDAAALSGRWKDAYKFYAKAAEASPDEKGLGDKIERARQRAIEESVLIARRCEGDGDASCVDAEATFVLQLQPGNAEIAELRRHARKVLAERELENARTAAGRSDFVAAIDSLDRFASLAPATESQEQRAGVLRDISPKAVEWARGVVNDEQARSSDDRLQQLRGSLRVLTALPDGDAVVVDATRTKISELERQQAKERAEKAAAEQKARANRNRTVSFTGALINVGKANGKEWDGFGNKNGKVASKLTQLAGAASPGVTAAAILGEIVGSGVSAPDAFGFAELSVNGRPIAISYTDGTVRPGFELAKRQDSYTPQWDGVTWKGVDLYKARLRITLRDFDLSEHDDIGIVEVDSEALIKAVDAGGVSWVSVEQQSNGQLLFVGISVF